MRVPDRRGHWAVRGWRVLPALLVVLLGAGLAPNVAVADDAVATTAETSAASITNARTGATYDDLATAVAEAQSGDTIKLGEGNYTLYGVNSTGHTKGMAPPTPRMRITLPRRRTPTGPPSRSRVLPFAPVTCLWAGTPSRTVRAPCTPPVMSSPSPVLP